MRCDERPSSPFKSQKRAKAATQPLPLLRPLTIAYAHVFALRVSPVLSLSLALAQVLTLALDGDGAALVRRSSCCLSHVARCLWICALPLPPPAAAATASGVIVVAAAAGPLQPLPLPPPAFCHTRDPACAPGVACLPGCLCNLQAQY